MNQSYDSQNENDMSEIILNIVNKSLTLFKIVKHKLRQIQFNKVRNT
jgi:hypothetical protein